MPIAAPRPVPASPAGIRAGDAQSSLSRCSGLTTGRPKMSWVWQCATCVRLPSTTPTCPWPCPRPGGGLKDGEQRAPETGRAEARGRGSGAHRWRCAEPGRVGSAGRPCRSAGKRVTWRKSGGDGGSGAGPVVVGSGARRWPIRRGGSGWLCGLVTCRTAGGLTEKRRRRRQRGRARGHRVGCSPVAVAAGAARGGALAQRTGCPPVARPAGQRGRRSAAAGRSVHPTRGFCQIPAAVWLRPCVGRHRRGFSRLS
ncbi:hypothetical protein EKD16_02245 [Streptomonospora litoralis]|uniref:Uncharacterized protein n=1 Tax=Streptomonospora litoralis TaxID=2498135 RepID=A0A4P6PW05_9ACTN|nr:hypothetical protein EKD16_02245 [Streptomonospora litoralis]